MSFNNLVKDSAVRTYIGILVQVSTHAKSFDLTNLLDKITSQGKTIRVKRVGVL